MSLVPAEMPPGLADATVHVALRHAADAAVAAGQMDAGGAASNGPPGPAALPRGRSVVGLLLAGLLTLAGGLMAYGWASSGRQTDDPPSGQEVKPGGSCGRSPTATGSSGTGCTKDAGSEQ